MPAVIGAGRGDVEEVRVAASALSGPDGPFRLRRPPGVTWPVPSTDRAAWPRLRPPPRRGRGGRHALTVSSQFGVVAAAAHPGRLGRPGPWAPAVARIEALYGPRHVLHLSLEEFARNLPARSQEAERWREGGRRVRWIRSHLRSAEGRREVRRMRALFRRFRGFGRPGLLVLFPTLRPSRSFRAEYPEAVEIGPLYPAPARRRRRGPPPRPRSGRARWIWYASPASCPELVEGLARGAERAGRRLVVDLRSDRPMGAPPPGRWVRFRRLPRLPARRWTSRFRAAELRLVTGSRSLLEAIDAGGPFLYFNGVTGRGARRRRHRPEKLDALLAAWRRAGASPRIRRDLADVARARRVAAVVADALADPAWAAAFPVGRPDPGLPAERSDGAAFVRAFALAWARSDRDVAGFLRGLRDGGRGSRP